MQFSQQKRPPKGITQSSLLQKSNMQMIKTQVDVLMDQIDVTIATVHEGGGNEVYFDLPINFNINGLDNKDAQLMVYTELISLYQEKGFKDIKIEPKPSKMIFHIRWINALASNEREKRRQMLAQYMQMPTYLHPARTPTESVLVMPTTPSSNNAILEHAAKNNTEQKNTDQ